MLVDYLEENLDDEVVEDEFEEGFIVMDWEELMHWCEGESDEFFYGD